MKHRSDCDCMDCWNESQRLLDISRRKVVPFPARDQPKACDAESMEMWFSFEESY